jgi:hypothetical protein
MRFSIRRAAAVAALLLSPACALAAEPVRTVAIYVEPFYHAARTPDERPQVGVGKQYNDLLSSNKREDILAARDLITGSPKLVTPMTLMVLAIRLYDVGLRNEAVFWFYAGKERYIVMSDVLDVKTQLLAQADDAMRFHFAGPIINGYAFCELAKQKVLQGSRMGQQPMGHVHGAGPASGDRAGIQRAIANAKERAAKERGYFDDAKNREAFYATRKTNEADAKFCWK